MPPTRNRRSNEGAVGEVSLKKTNTPSIISPSRNIERPSTRAVTPKLTPASQRTVTRSGVATPSNVKATRSNAKTVPVIKEPPMPKSVDRSSKPTIDTSAKLSNSKSASNGKDETQKPKPATDKKLSQDVVYTPERKSLRHSINKDSSATKTVPTILRSRGRPPKTVNITKSDGKVNSSEDKHSTEETAKKTEESAAEAKSQARVSGRGIATRKAAPSPLIADTTDKQPTRKPNIKQANEAQIKGTSGKGNAEDLAETDLADSEKGSMSRSVTSNEKVVEMVSSPRKRPAESIVTEPAGKKQRPEEEFSLIFSPRKSSRQSKMSAWFKDMELDLGKMKEKKQKRKSSAAEDSVMSPSTKKGSSGKTVGTVVHSQGKGTKKARSGERSDPEPVSLVKVVRGTPKTWSKKTQAGKKVPLSNKQNIQEILVFPDGKSGTKHEALTVAVSVPPSTTCTPITIVQAESPSKETDSEDSLDTSGDDSLDEGDVVYTETDTLPIGNSASASKPTNVSPAKAMSESPLKSTSASPLKSTSTSPLKPTSVPTSKDSSTSPLKLVSMSPQRQPLELPSKGTSTSPLTPTVVSPLKQEPVSSSNSTPASPQKPTSVPPEPDPASELVEIIEEQKTADVHNAEVQADDTGQGQILEQVQGQTIELIHDETLGPLQGQSVQTIEGQIIEPNLGQIIQIVESEFQQNEVVHAASSEDQVIAAERTVKETKPNDTSSNLTYQSVVFPCEEENKNPKVKTISVDIQTDPISKQKKQQEFVIVRLPEGTPIQEDTLIDVNRMAEEDGVKCEVNVELGTFRCLECNYLTKKKANWYKHKKKHSGLKPYVCSICSYSSSTSSNLRRHINIHNDVRRHHCDKCGLMFRQKIHLERHIKYKHETKRVQCPQCDYICANENPDLKVHIKRRHQRQPDLNSGENFTCEECGLVAISRKDYKQHMKFHRKGPELKLFCELCSFVTDCESRMSRHMLIHTREKPYQCGMCEYRGTQKEHVVRHMKTQHQVIIPDKSVARTVTISTEANLDSSNDADDSGLVELRMDEDSLSNPETSSSLDPDKKYDKADFSTRDKIFACNHCTMKFAKLINLYKHLHSQHKSIMPSSVEEFSCVVCEFRTNSKKNLLVHMRKHNLLDQSPPTHVYSCVLCNYVNPKRRNLFQHMKKKHKIEIVMKDDGSANCFIAENSNLASNSAEGSNENLMTVGDIVTASTSGETQFQVVTDSGPSRIVSISDLANAIALPQNSDGVVYIDQASGTKAVTEMDLTDLQLESINVQHEAAEAIQGLQALAEQSQRHALESPGSGVESSLRGVEVEAEGLEAGLTVEGDEGSELTVEESEGAVLAQHVLTEEVLEESTVMEVTPEVGEEVSASVGEMAEVSSSDLLVEGAAVETDTEEERTGIQLSSDQLMNLSSGDFVEINGEMYKVEFTTDTPAS